MLDNVAWYGRRLRAMSPRELAERASRSFRHRVDAVEFRAAPRVWRSRWYPPLETILRESPREARLGFVEPARAAGLRTMLPDDAELLAERAATVLEGRFRFFGYPEAILTDRSEDIDPFTGLPWPRSHAKRVDFRRGEIGDPKWIWELNRCQDLPLLAAASLVTEDARYAGAASDRMEHWIASHPPGRGIAWSSGFEAGIRAISLAVAMDALRGSPQLPRERAEKALVSLWQHARWIERDPSKGSSANNHRIGELVGLVVIGRLAPELADSVRFLDLGLSELEREADLQVRADGTSVEQAYGYHVFVLDLLLVAAATLAVTGHPVPSRIRDALERSGDALWAQVSDDEPEPTYGDSDESRALVLDGRERRTGRSIAGAIGALCGHARAARVAGRLDATTWWLFGEEGAARFDGVERAAAPGSAVLPDGGVTILRRSATRVTIDHGPHGYLGIAAHGHADALRIDVAHGHEELVVDPGVGSYARPLVREAFRSTAFHATVTVDGVSSSVSGGPFLWTRHASSKLLFVDLGARIVMAQHDGYTRLRDPVTHVRTVALLDDAAVVVLDRLEGRELHSYSQRWPFYPGLELQSASTTGVHLGGRGSGLALAFRASQDFHVDTACGDDVPLRGWWSEQLESFVPAVLASVDLEATGPVYIAALLVPNRGDSVPPAEIDLAVDERASTVELYVGERREAVEICFDPPTATRARSSVVAPAVE